MAKASKKNSFNVKVEKKPESPIGDSEALQDKIEETTVGIDPSDAGDYTAVYQGSSSVSDDLAQHPKFAKFKTSGDTKK